ncbi:MAG: hypothetical protein KAT15_02260 [Bacteroidales bacterium]|nr:hypothetical protein [Bacteroidales bacterium]
MNETFRLTKEFLPLNREEMHDIQAGGILLGILGGLIIAGGAVIFNDWDNFKAGLKRLPEVK